jgi:colicin import membrane protein
LRITGTGLAHRKALNEVCWRDLAEWLNAETVARCAGLPVIWEQPEGKLLTSDEFARRIIGTIIYPYVKGREVWGIARFLDEDAIEALAKAACRRRLPSCFATWP